MHSSGTSKIPSVSQVIISFRGRSVLLLSLSLLLLQWFLQCLEHFNLRRNCYGPMTFCSFSIIIAMVVKCYVKKRQVSRGGTVIPSRSFIGGVRRFTSMVCDITFDACSSNGQMISCFSCYETVGKTLKKIFYSQ